MQTLLLTYQTSAYLFFKQPDAVEMQQICCFVLVQRRYLTWRGKPCISCSFILCLTALLCFSSKLLGNKHSCLGLLSKWFLKGTQSKLILFFQSFEKEEKLLFAIFQGLSRQFGFLFLFLFCFLVSKFIYLFLTLRACSSCLTETLYQLISNPHFSISLSSWQSPFHSLILGI